MQRLAAQANVHLAFVANVFYLPDCNTTTASTEQRLTAQAVDRKSDLEKAVGYRLRLVSVEALPQYDMLCPGVHPLQIGYTNQWTVPSNYNYVNYGDVVISGTARYDIEAPLQARPASSPTITSSDGIIPYTNWLPDQFAELPSGHYLATNATADFDARPTAALLEYAYASATQAQVNTRIAHLHAIGIANRDVFTEKGSADPIRVWIRFMPITMERAAQVNSVMTVGGEPIPSLALFTNNCAGYSSAIALAFEQTQRQAIWNAGRLDTKTLGPILSIAISEDIQSYANCGFPPTATTERLVHGIVDSKGLNGYTEPLSARFAVRVDVAWALQH